MDEVMASAVFVIVKSDIDGWCVQRQELAKIYWGKQCGAQRRLLVSFTNDETPGSGPSLMTLTMLW